MKIELTPNVEVDLWKTLRVAGKYEVGGMLFAEQIDVSHFSIIDFSVDLHSGTETSFKRNPQVHQASLNSFFNRTNRDFKRFNYLGEWHSHPSFAIWPSAKDLSTMMEMVSNDCNSIPFVLLLIARLKRSFLLNYSFTLFAKGQSPKKLQAVIRRFEADAI